MELSESLDGITAPAEARWVTSADGTRIAAFRIGTGPLLWVVPPAMGAPLLSMKRLFEPLARRCTIVTWDMRGFFASDAPDDPEAYDVDRHLEDMDAVLESFGAKKSFVLGGWSMGVQLSLEAYHRNPDRVRALLLVAGPYQRALQAILPGVHPHFARGLERAYDVGPTVTRLVDRALKPAWLPRALSRVGLLSRHSDLFDRVIERFRTVDWGRYLTVVRYLHQHDAEPYLSKITAPTLIACGTRDFLTPLAVSKRMHSMIEDAELFVVPRATHYIVVEHGDLIAARIERFLDKVRVQHSGVSKDDEPTVSAPRPSGEIPQPTLLAGRYEVQALLGTGGMGSVFLARDAELDELVALKMLKGSDPTLLERFRDEVRLARKVTHKNVARTFDIGEHDGEKFLTMEYVSGDSLAREVEREGPLLVREILRIGGAMCAGLAAAHEVGVIHRDFKPGNVMIASDGRVVITDFGLATKRHVKEEQIVGTLQYMAPEQFAGQPVDERADIYALGGVIYRMATSLRPFEELPNQRKAAPNPCSHRDQLPEAIGEIVMRCLAPSPADRFASALDVGSALAAVRAPVEHEAAPSTRRVGRLVGQLRRIALVLAGGDASAEGLRVAVLERLGNHPVLRLTEPDDAEAIVTMRVVIAPERMKVQMHATSGGVQFWSLGLSEPWSRAIDFVTSITTSILEALNLDVGGSHATAPLPPEMIEQYLEARVHLRVRAPERAQRAIEMLERMLADAPDHPLLLSSLANARVRLSFFRGGEYEAAVRASNRAMAVGADLAEAHTAVGMMAWQGGDSGTAVPSLLRALELAPGLADARLTLGVILMEAGIVVEGLRLTLDAVTRVPTLFTAWADMARTHELVSNAERAETCLATIPASDFGGPLARATRIRFAAWRRDPATIASLAPPLLALPEQHPIRVVGVLYTSVALDGTAPRALWEKHRSNGSPRRHAFEAQILTELAAYARDWDLAIEGLEMAIGHGLQDRIWIDRCPLLQDLLGTRRFEDFRDVMRTRARQVLDALDAAPSRR